jgi:hypothetical protein
VAISRQQEKEKTGQASEQGDPSKQVDRRLEELELQRSKEHAEFEQRVAREARRNATKQVQSLLIAQEVHSRFSASVADLEEFQQLRVIMNKLGESRPQTDLESDINALRNLLKSDAFRPFLRPWQADYLRDRPLRQTRRFGR